MLTLFVACGGAPDSDTGVDSTHLDRGASTEWLNEITGESGLDFVHFAGDNGQRHMPEITGAGVALFDFDNDGDLDLYLTNGNGNLPTGAEAEAPVNHLYRHDPGGKFVDVTTASGLGDGGYGLGLAIGDFDNDGYRDLYLTNLGPDKLFRNRGDGTFEEITDSAGIDADGWSTSAAFFDYDLDGYLDLYIARYVIYVPNNKCFDSAGRPDYCGPKVFEPIHDILLHNNGDGTFEDVSERAGITSVAGAGLGVVSEDFDDDGRPDMYVANDGYANQLWINQGDGTFKDQALVRGVALNLHGQAEAGMGVLSADLDNDGHYDLFMTHLRNESNTMYRNLGGMRGFRDDTGKSGLGASSVPYTGFGTAALDVDLDGDLDIAVANGRVVYGDPLPDADVGPPWNIYAEPNLFYLNDGSGTFQELKEEAAGYCGKIEVTRGLAVGDLDHDGDPDLVIGNVNGPARIYRNDAPRGNRHWIAVNARDPRYLRDAIGARVNVTTELGRQIRTLSTGYSYISSSEPVARFGLGSAEKILTLEVRWLDGLVERFEAGAVDREITVVRGEGKPAT